MAVALTAWAANDAKTELVELLACAALTAAALLNAVWGYESIPFTRTVDMHIAKLRKKIEDTPVDPRFIVTVHGVGYKFVG